MRIAYREAASLRPTAMNRQPTERFSHALSVSLVWNLRPIECAHMVEKDCRRQEEPEILKPQR